MKETKIVRLRIMYGVFALVTLIGGMIVLYKLGILEDLNYSFSVIFGRRL